MWAYACELWEEEILLREWERQNPSWEDLAEEQEDFVQSITQPKYLGPDEILTCAFMNSDGHLTFGCDFPGLGFNNEGRSPEQIHMAPY